MATAASSAALATLNPSFTPRTRAMRRPQSAPPVRSSDGGERGDGQHREEQRDLRQRERPTAAADREVHDPDVGGDEHRQQDHPRQDRGGRRSGERRHAERHGGGGHGHARGQPPHVRIAGTRTDYLIARQVRPTSPPASSVPASSVRASSAPTSPALARTGLATTGRARTGHSSCPVRQELPVQSVPDQAAYRQDCPPSRHRSRWIRSRSRLATTARRGHRRPRRCRPRAGRRCPAHRSARPR